MIVTFRPDRIPANAKRRQAGGERSWLRRNCGVERGRSTQDGARWAWENLMLISK